jgi:simple sugar transport system ATP-binding protein
MAYLEMRGITKLFPGVVANEHVDLFVEKGTIHALLGENGAGKSTLMKILYGIYEPDEGEIFLNDELLDIPNPQAAIDIGIGMVHQEFQLVPSLTVTENIALGHELKKGIWIDREREKAVISEITDKFGFSTPLDLPVADLPVGAQQQVEIIKLLYRQAKLLILDEPTAVLTPQETENLFKVLKNLRDEGKTIIYITHKLREVRSICKTASILRHGKMVDTVDVSQTTEKELASLMVGEQILSQKFHKSEKVTDEHLRLTDIHALDDRNIPAIQDLSMSLHGGEIVGLAGVQGNGQSELVEVIAGLRAARGHVIISGKDVSTDNLRKRRESGLAIIPEKRIEQGLNLKADITSNVIANRYYKKPFVHAIFLRWDEALKFAKQIIERLNIKAEGPKTIVNTLSGGNQQKVIIGRELDKNPKVIIAAHPTRGLDVLSAQFVREKLIRLRDSGSAILLISADLDEIFAVSDRILVIYEGRIIGEKLPDQTTYKEIGLLMAGHNES